MFPTQCEAVYDRILPGDLAPTHVRCTYINGHGARHSYETLKVVDEAEAAIHVPQPTLPTNLAEVLVQVQRGDLDNYVELILSVGHDRKLSRRGTAGFPRNGVGA